MLGSWQATFEAYIDDPHPAVFILTSETKRRLWIDAEITTGDPIRVFVNNAEMSCSRLVLIEKLRNAIALVSECLAHGFSKQAIATSLFSQRKIKNALGFVDVRLLETRCIPFRGTSHFVVALMIGTKND